MKKQKITKTEIEKVIKHIREGMSFSDIKKITGSYYRPKGLALSAIQKIREKFMWKCTRCGLYNAPALVGCEWCSNDR